jgi:hypothetical protein
MDACRAALRVLRDSSGGRGPVVDVPRPFLRDDRRNRLFF